MSRYTMNDYKGGKVICDYCRKPVYDPEKAMEHKPTEKVYHEDLCFEKAFNAQLEERGLGTSSMPLELRNAVKDLFGIPRNSGK